MSKGDGVAFDTQAAGKNGERDLQKRASQKGLQRNKNQATAKGMCVFVFILLEQLPPVWPGRVRMKKTARPPSQIQDCKHEFNGTDVLTWRWNRMGGSAVGLGGWSWRC